MKSILLIDHNRASLAAARAFHGMGYRVIAGVAGYCDYANLSRFVSETLPLPDLVDAPDAFLRTLTDIAAARPDISGVFSIDETGVRWLAHNRDRLPKSLMVYNARPEHVLGAFDKSESARLAVDLDIPTAPYQVVDSLDDLHAAAREIKPPFVIRAVESNHDLYGSKVVVCPDMQAFQRTATHWPREAHKKLMVQRFNAGRRHNICWNAIEGRIHSAIEMRVLKTTTGTHSGYGTLVETVEPDPRLKDYAARLAEALGYHGAGSPQFLVDDRTGEVTFLEINPRLDANIKLAETVMPYIQTHARIMEGRAPRRLVDPWAYKRGKRLVWLKGENQTLKTLIGRGDWARCAVRAATMPIDAIGNVHAVWSWDDPVPALACQLNPLIRHIPESKRPAFLRPAATA